MTDEEKEAMDAAMARLDCSMKIEIAPKIETNEFKDYTKVHEENNAKIDEVLSRIENLRPEEMEIVEYRDSIAVRIIFAKSPEQEE